MGVKPSISAVGDLSIRDKVITTCKRCRSGIKESDERVWICEPLMVGLVHANPADCHAPIPTTSRS